jgi:hypothetical protein
VPNVSTVCGFGIIIRNMIDFRIALWRILDQTTPGRVIENKVILINLLPVRFFGRYQRGSSRDTCSGFSGKRQVGFRFEVVFVIRIKMNEVKEACLVGCTTNTFGAEFPFLFVFFRIHIGKVSCLNVFPGSKLRSHSLFVTLAFSPISRGSTVLSLFGRIRKVRAKMGFGSATMAFAFLSGSLGCALVFLGSHFALG